jgi:drug/metabolite transporter (DMT)-like permease
MFGFLAILGVTLFFSFNQMIIKETTVGLQPVFFAGLRSALAVVFVVAWLWYRGLLGRVMWADIGAGVAIGLVFSIEFLGLFIALDLTAVSRAAVIAHFGLAGEQLTRLRLIGLLIAFCGTGLAILSRDTGGHGNLLGDLCALLGAFGWAGTAYLARATNLRIRGPEVQLFWMVAVSAVILLLAAPFFGPLIRDIQPIRATQLKIQPNSAWADTWDWLNKIERAGSIPAAINPAAASCVAWRSLAGSCQTVIACMSTRQ